MPRHPGWKAQKCRPGVCDQIQDVKDPGLRSLLLEYSFVGFPYLLAVTRAQHPLQDVLIVPVEPSLDAAEGFGLLQGLDHLVYQEGHLLHRKRKLVAHSKEMGYIVSFAHEDSNGSISVSCPGVHRAVYGRGPALQNAALHNSRRLH